MDYLTSVIAEMNAGVRFIVLVTIGLSIAALIRYTTTTAEQRKAEANDEEIRDEMRLW